MIPIDRQNNNKSLAPYYDDYDSSKQYTHLLAVPGRVAQARELTQVQSTVKDIIKSIGDSILKDGDVVEGCQVIVADDKLSVTVTSGKVYMNGMVLPVAETTLDISGTGTELIGIKLKEYIVDEHDDASLKDPAIGYDNYNQAGCHRIRSTIEIVKDDSDAATLTTLVDGDISVEKYAPNYDTLTQTLARRTYDESGSYIVEGLNVRAESAAETNNFNIVVESGKAYVLGYELRIPAPRRIVLPRSLTYSPVTTTERYDDTISSYELSSAPYVRAITSVRGEKSKTVTQTITSNTDAVLLDELEIGSISVTQGEGETARTFTVGSSSSGDCYKQRVGTRYYLKWNGTENYPTLNTSYSVTYTYTHTFIKDTDYELTHDESSGKDSHNLTWISGGDAPNDNTDFTIVYDQYLARRDTVYIDQYGNIASIQGTPAEYGFEITPESPMNTLSLATISIPPAGTVSSNPNLRISVSNVGLTRFTMNDIQSLLNRMRTIEYDQAILSLNDEARQYETTSGDKRGIFTDPLIDISKIDFYYNLASGVAVDNTLPVYDVTIDLDSSICYLPTITKTYDAVYSDSSTIKKYSRTATLSVTNRREVLSQMNATKSFLINPYEKFPQMPEISITPASDTWIEDRFIDVPISQTTEEVVSMSTRNINKTTTNSRKRGTTSSYKDTPIGTKISEVSREESVISEESITYIQQKEITVEGSQFPPNLDNIKGYFDGVLVALTPVPDTTTIAGTETGSIKSDSTGRFAATFTIPENVLTGIREVRLESESTVVGYEEYGRSAFALYQAAGVLRTIQRTVTTLTTVLMNRVTTVTTTSYIDPVGQTFVLNRMTILSGIDLYFESKPEGDVPVTCEIREVLNGTITPKILGHRTLSASEVDISSDSQTATRFDFEEPVLLEENKEYAFVVRSTSAAYRIWVADLGGTDILTGESVLTNPYLIGVMLSSSNNSSWTTHQTTDIKFKLIEDVYADTSDLLFDNITATDEFSRIYLLADSAIPNGTSVDWYYSTDDGTSYTAIAPYSLKLLDQMKGSMKIKAVLRKKPESNLSPIVAIDNVGTVLSSYDGEGYYITKNITGLDSYTAVDIVIDSYIPSNTGISVYVSTGSTLTEATLQESSRGLSYGWKEQTYKATVTSATQCRVFIKLESDYEYFTPAFRRLRVIMS